VPLQQAHSLLSRFAAGSIPLILAIFDIDGDGKPDLAVANQNGNVSVFRNTSSYGSITSGSFAAKVDFTAGTVQQVLLVVI